MSTSVILVNYGVPTLTLVCIQSLLHFSFNEIEEIIVSNNFHADFKEDHLRSLQAMQKVKVLNHAKNLGFAQANNRAAEIARGQYLLFLNNDTQLKENSLTALFKTLKSMPNAGLVGCNLVYADGKPQHASGKYPLFYRILMEGWSKRLFGPGWYNRNIALEDEPQSEGESNSVEYITGACILTSREVWEDLGGFDEDYFFYFEDCDLGYRARKKGYASLICTTTEIIHIGGNATSLQASDFSTTMYYRHLNIFTRKNFPIIHGFLVRRTIWLKALIFARLRPHNRERWQLIAQSINSAN